MTRMLLCTAVLCGAIMASTNAAEARSCGDRAKIIERLQSKYGEERNGAGLASNNGIVEVFSSAETGTWTIIVTMPSGRSCLVAAGEGWESGPLEMTKSGLPT